MKINKHRLEFDKVYSFFFDHIKCDKTLSQEVVKKSEIKKAIYQLDVIWHSLIILVDGFDGFPDYLDEAIFAQICSKIKYIIVGAYDREGYIFWEKKSR